MLTFLRVALTSEKSRFFENGVYLAPKGEKVEAWGLFLGNPREKQTYDWCRLYIL